MRFWLAITILQCLRLRTFLNNPRGTILSSSWMTNGSELSSVFRHILSPWQLAYFVEYVFLVPIGCLLARYLRKCRCNAYGKGLEDDKDAHIIGFSFTRSGPSEIAHGFWWQEGDRTLLAKFKLKLKLHGKVAVT